MGGLLRMLKNIKGHKPDPPTFHVYTYRPKPRLQKGRKVIAYQELVGGRSMGGKFERCNMNCKIRLNTSAVVVQPFIKCKGLGDHKYLKEIF